MRLILVNFHPFDYQVQGIRLVDRTESPVQTQLNAAVMAQEQGMGKLPAKLRVKISDGTRSCQKAQCFYSGD